MREIDKHTAKKQSYKAVQYDLSELIDPSDVTGVDDDVTEWSEIDEDTLNWEIHESISIMLSERQQPWDSLIRDLAYIQWRDSMPRISMDKLATDDRRMAVATMDIWPNKVDKWTALEWLHEAGEPPNEFYQESREVVEQAMYYGLHPTKELDL
jgi:hypothetical protein